MRLVVVYGIGWYNP